MKLTRKIFAIILTISMILSLGLVGQAVEFTDVPVTHERYEAITELAGRGIINGYGGENDTYIFKPDQAVTRAEMAKLIATMFSISDTTTGANIFSDVADDFWARNFIIGAKDMGIINGYTDGTYKPNKEVNWQEAVKMIVCALNWGTAAEETYPNPEGDWAYCYRTMGQKLGLTQGAVMTYTDPAPRGVIAQLFYNALSIPRATAVTGADGKITYVAEENSAITEQSKYKTMKNVKLICTPTTNLVDGTLAIKDGYVRVKDLAGNTFDMSVDGNTRIYSLIGRYLDVSYEEKDKEYTIKSARDLSSVTEFELDKIKSVASNSIEYYVDDNFYKTAKIDFSTIDVIYNERPLKDSTDFVGLLSDAVTLSLSGDSALNYFGNVTVAKANNHAIITIKAYKSYYMSTAVSSTNAETTGYEVTLDNRTNKLVLNVKDDINNEIVKKSSLTDAGTVQTSISIATKSIVTFAESAPDSIGNKRVEFLTNSSKKTGTVEEVTSAKAPYKGKIKIGSTTYLVKNAGVWSQLETKASVTSTVTYLTDASGEIVYIDSISSGNERFAFFSEFVSGDTSEDDSAVFKFYDPEAKSTFQAVISDADDIKNILEPGKDAGKLFWVNVKGGKIASGDIKYAENAPVVSDASTADDDDILSVSYITGDNISETTTGFIIRTQGEADKTITVISSGKLRFLKPDLAKSAVTYSTSSMTVSTALNYKNPEVYQIVKKDSTKAIVLFDPLKQLQTNSPVYVVNESVGQTSVDGTNVKLYSYYDFKTGKEGSKELAIAENIAASLALKKGDVLTYYKDSDKAGIDIDKLDCVYILLRASEVAQNRGSNFAFNSEITNGETQNASSVTTGFRKHRMDTVHNLGKNYYNYTLTLPLWYDETNNKLALARTNTSSDGELRTYLAHDTELSDKLAPVFGGTTGWGKTAIFEAMGNDITEKALSTSLKVFVYDKTKSEETMLVNMTGSTSEELKAFWSGIETLEKSNVSDASQIPTAARECSLIYSYFPYYSSTLTTLYIIK